MRRPALFRKTDEGVPAEENQELVAGKKLKRTFYLPSATVEQLQELQFTEWQRTKERPDLSNLVTRAIALLHQQAGKTA